MNMCCSFCVQGAELFDVWFRVDARPFKQALVNTVKRWSFMFKQHLIDHVTNRSAATAVAVTCTSCDFPWHCATCMLGYKL